MHPERDIPFAQPARPAGQEETPRCLQCGRTDSLQRYRCVAYRQRSAQVRWDLTGSDLTFRGVEDLAGWVCDVCVVTRQRQLLWPRVFIPALVGCGVTALGLILMIVFRFSRDRLSRDLVVPIGVTLLIGWAFLLFFLAVDFPRRRRAGERVVFDFYSRTRGGYRGYGSSRQELQ
jgi:hypothetical protein